MITHRFPATGGTPWHDLEEDRPWSDPALEADRRQDAIAAGAAAALTAELPAAAAIARERFGHPAVLAEERYARPSPAPATVPGVARTPGLDDHDLSQYRRRKTLNGALVDVPAATYRRGARAAG